MPKTAFRPAGRIYHISDNRPYPIRLYTCTRRWLHGTVVERWSLTGELSLSSARPAADG